MSELAAACWALMLSSLVVWMLKLPSSHTACFIIMATKADPKDLASAIEWVMTSDKKEEAEAYNTFLRYLEKKRPPAHDDVGFFGPNFNLEEGMNPPMTVEDDRICQKCEFVLEKMVDDENKRELGLRVLKALIRIREDKIVLHAVSRFFGNQANVTDASAKEVCLLVVSEESSVIRLSILQNKQSIKTLVDLMPSFLDDAGIQRAILQRLSVKEFPHFAREIWSHKDTVFQTLEAHIADSSVVLPAVELTSKLAQNVVPVGPTFMDEDEREDYMIGSNYAPLLVRIMELHSECSDIVELACKTLLTRETRDSEEQFRSLGENNRDNFIGAEDRQAFVGALVNTLRNSPSNENLQADAVHILGSFLAALTFDFDSDDLDEEQLTTERREAEAIANTVLNGGGIELALKTLKTFHQNYTVVYGAAGLVCGMTWYENGRKELLQKGSVQTLLAAIEQDILCMIDSDEEFPSRSYRECITALAKLVSRDETGVAVSTICQEEGGVARVVDAVIRFGTPDREGYYNEEEPYLGALLAALANRESRDGKMPLHYAVSSINRPVISATTNQIRIVIHLVNNFAETASVSDASGDLPLHTAIKNGSWQLLFDLIGANFRGLSTRDGRGCLPLHAAIEAEAPFETIELLLKFHEPAGKEVCRHDPNLRGFPPAIMAAAVDCDISCIYHLLRHDPSVVYERDNNTISSSST